MADFVSRKMKRKGIGDDAFGARSDFLVSTPASKIRRLDGIVSPKLELEPEFYDVPEYGPSVEHPLDMEGDRTQPTSITPEVGLPFMLNKERSLVLYNPMESSSYMPLLNLPTPVPSGISYTVDSNIITSLKNHSLTSEKIISWNGVGTTDRLAVVPWVPPPHLPSVVSVADEVMPSEPIEAEAMETDMDEDTETCVPMPVPSSIEVLQRQQHCMSPQTLHTTPIMSSW